jgi:hypothetical protein
MIRRGHAAPLIPDAEFELLTRLFENGLPPIEYGTVLMDESEAENGEIRTDVHAYLIHLEGDSIVLLESAGRVSCIRGDDLNVGRADELQVGDRLVIVKPEAREFIASRVLAARRDEERDSQPHQIIRQWQEELKHGMERLGLGCSEILRKIKARGSARATPSAIRQWVTGEILGPLDPQDIRRVGEVIESNWLSENWQRVWSALFVVRNGHRLLGRRITELIQKKAVLGSQDLASKDEKFLNEVGITIGALQDAVTVLSVEQIIPDAGMFPIDRIGRVVPA